MLKTKITKYCGKPCDINTFSAKSVLNVAKIINIGTNGLFIIHKEYRALTYRFIIRSAVAVKRRLGSVLLSAAILFGNPWDRQSTAAQKGFPLPSGLVNLGRKVVKLRGDQRNLREQNLNPS